MKYQLDKAERKALLDEKLMRRIAEMFLDLEQRYTHEQMAEILGLKIHQLRRYTSRGEFQEIYNETLAAITGRSRLSVLHDMQAEALVLAYKRHKSILDDEEVSAAIALQAIRLVYDTLRLQRGDESEPDDRRELQEYQKELGIKFSGTTVNVYLQALAETEPQDRPAPGEYTIVEGDSQSKDESLPSLLEAGTEDTDAGDREPPEDL